MKQKREKLKVVYDILKAIRSKNGEIKPTHVMYKANLSHQMLDMYLKDLIDKELIVEHRLKGKKYYSITKKGMEYIEKYKVIIDFVDSFGLDY